MAKTNDLPVESLLNLGPQSGQWLRQAGIATIAELERLGPVVAYRLVRQRQPKASLNLLWAMAAGLKAKDWRELTEATKKRLQGSGSMTSTTFTPETTPNTVRVAD